jgi:hypothetical protein
MSQAATKIARTVPARKGQASASPSSRAAQGARQVVTYETAEALCPTATQAANIARLFGLDEVDEAAVRETAEEAMGKLGQVLRPHLNDRALAMALQRFAGACVGSAFGAGQFYSNKVSEAQAATNRVLNGGEDEDREEGSGFATGAQRKREFAAEVGLQARALLVAAEGALSAYAHLTGEEWKPYTPAATPSGGALAVSRDAAKAQMGAFG